MLGDGFAAGRLDSVELSIIFGEVVQKIASVESLQRRRLPIENGLTRSAMHGKLDGQSRNQYCLIG